MRDPQGRELVRAKTTMRLAFEEAVAREPNRQPWAAHLAQSKAGLRRAPSWSISRKGGRR